jgi:hypothetical protein
MTRPILTAVVLLASIASAYGGGAPKNMIGVQESMAATARRPGKTYCNCHGSYAARPRTSGQTANLYNSPGNPVGPSASARATYSGNSMGPVRRPYSGQAAAAAGGVMRQYDAKGRNVGSVAR